MTDNSSIQSSSQATNEENVHLIEDSNGFVYIHKSYNTIGLCILFLCVASFVIQTVIVIILN